MRAASPTLIDILLERERGAADRPYIVDVRGPRLTYGDAVREAHRWAAAWRRIGVGIGDTVVTVQLNTSEAFLSWLGLAWLGAVEVPVNVDYRGRLLTHALNLSKARVIGVEARYGSRLAEVADQLDHLKTVVVLDDGDPGELPFEVVTRAELWADVEPAVDLDPPASHDIAVIIFTSGTTGPSKAVRMPWGQLHATSSGVVPIEDLGPDDVVYNPGPTFHLASRSMAFLTALVGGRQVMVPYLSMSDLSRVYAEHGVTTSGALPPDWLAAPPSPADADVALRNLIAPIRIAGIDEIRRRFGLRTFGCFSMTEVSVPIRDRGWDAARYDDHGRMSCGQVREGYPGYEIRVVDEKDHPAPPGEVGELLVRAAEPWTMNAGYLDMPEATAAAWRNGWFHTGDAFIVDDDGSCYFIDRIKDCIRRHGENISSAEVEAHLTEHPDVLAAAAVAVRKAAGPGSDEEVHTFVVRRQGSPLTAHELVTWLIPRMPRFMVPRYVDLVDDLPKTPTMKVRKAELRERGIGPTTWDREAEGLEIPRL